jgi:hypothetical protein
MARNPRNPETFEVPGATQTAYYLDVRMDEWNLYLKHIVSHIYGISEGQYTAEPERNGKRRIQFKTNIQFPLINSLPDTISDITIPPHFDDPVHLEVVDKAIRLAIDDFFRPGSTYYQTPLFIPMHPAQLDPIVRQLAKEGKIWKFIALPWSRFMINVKPYPIAIILKVVDNYLSISFYADLGTYFFDVDDGYQGQLVCLNPSWERWKELDDITAPIHPPNYV